MYEVREGSAMDKPLAVRLADRARRLASKPLPEEVRRITIDMVVDQIGVQICGSALPNVAPVARFVASVGGAPECTVTGSGYRTNAPYAAYVNGTFGHA